MKQELTDRKLKALKPQPKVYEIMDSLVNGLGVRVLTSGRRSFMLYRRFPGSNKPVRRSLGSYPEMTLAEARDQARDWILKAKKGIDPTAEAKRNKEAALEAERKQKASTFKAAFEAYLKRKASKLKSGPDIEREMRREFRDWMDKPLADITPAMVKEAIKAIAGAGRKGGTQACGQSHGCA
jgi:hypothetical protein